MMPTWFTTLATDGAATKVEDGAEFVWISASEAVVTDVVGTMANESDREPSKSISALFEVAGAAEKRDKVQ